MNAGLRALLVGVLTTGAGAAVYSYKAPPPEVTYVDLQDAGIANDCNPRLVVCTERVNPVLRVRLADAGDVLPAARRYARIVRQAQRCPNPDGGVAELVVPGFEQYASDSDLSQVPEPVRCIDRPCTDFAGFCGGGPKQVRLAAAMGLAEDCVRAPVGGGTGCKRAEGDGGFRYFGAGNVFSAALSNGDATCEPVACSVFLGDDPDVSL